MYPKKRNRLRVLALLLSFVLALCVLTGAAIAEEPFPDTPEGPTTETAEQPPAEEYIPDPVGSISFTNLEHRLRENKLRRRNPAAKTPRRLNRRNLNRPKNRRWKARMRWTPMCRAAGRTAP